MPPIEIPKNSQKLTQRLLVALNLTLSTNFQTLEVPSRPSYNIQDAFYLPQATSDPIGADSLCL